MGIIGEDSLAMIHNDNIAGIKQVFGQPDDPEIGCIDRCARLGTQVGAPVVALKLSVKQPLSSKSAGDITGKWPVKTAIPQAGAAAAGINAADLFFFVF